MSSTGSYTQVDLKDGFIQYADFYYQCQLLVIMMTESYIESTKVDRANGILDITVLHQ